MSAPNRIPRNITRALLWLYIFMGIASVAIGASLSVTAYQLRVVSGFRRGTGFVMAVGLVVIAFGLWRCCLALYHIRRLNSTVRSPSRLEPPRG